MIFNDVINEPVAMRKNIATHYTNGSLHNISPISIFLIYFGRIFDTLELHEFLFVDKNNQTVKKNFDELIGV